MACMKRVVMIHKLMIRNHYIEKKSVFWKGAVKKEKDLAENKSSKIP